jgi:hypothetical protein
MEHSRSVQKVSLGSRPYRSHIVPACDECRRGKIRCIIDMSGPPCQLCRKRQTNCQVSSGRRKVRSSQNRITGGRLPVYGRSGHETEATRGLAQFPSITGASPTESSMLLNPTMAQDVEVLERYLTAQDSSMVSASRPYNTIWTGSGRPIIYLTVPRYRKGTRSGYDPGRTQREILENILGPLKSELINVYV